MPGGMDSRGHRDGQLERSQSRTATDGKVPSKKKIAGTKEKSLKGCRGRKGAESSSQRLAATFEITASTSSVDQLLHHVILEVWICREEMNYRQSGSKLCCDYVLHDITSEHKLRGPTLTNYCPHKPCFPRQRTGYSNRLLRQWRSRAGGVSSNCCQKKGGRTLAPGWWHG